MHPDPRPGAPQSRSSRETAPPAVTYVTPTPALPRVPHLSLSLAPLEPEHLPLSLSIPLALPLLLGRLPRLGGPLAPSHLTPP